MPTPQEEDAIAGLLARPAYVWTLWARLYNAYMGTGIDHVRFRALFESMGPIEQADLMDLLTYDGGSDGERTAGDPHQ